MCKQTHINEGTGISRKFCLIADDNELAKLRSGRKSGEDHLTLINTLGRLTRGQWQAMGSLNRSEANMSYQSDHSYMIRPVSFNIFE
jgi:hypothetical protein